MKTPASGSSETPTMAEERYSLREMLAEVVGERESGAFGMEKLRRDDIRQVFVAKTRKRRVPGT
jgi:hypothetical protein